LVLVPSLVLVLIVLGGISVDAAVAHAAQRDLYRTLSAAADDAAAMVDQRQLQLDGTVRLDEDAARRVVQAHLAASSSELGEGARGADHPHHIRAVQVEVDDTTVGIEVEAVAPHVFLSAVPGMPDGTRVHLAVTGRLQP
jgi:hypothetical protein